MQWLKLLSFGPSMSSRSFLHELDPRSKLMFVVTYVSLVTHSNELVSMVLYTSIGLLFVYAARLPLRYVWHGLKGLFPIMLLFICYQLLFGDVKHAFILPWKLMLFMITLIVFSATTTPTKLADGLESILKPLTFIRFPVQNFVMMISVAFRFIPI